MSLPAAWVDRIFEKLTLLYGQPFLRRWDGIDLETVKADWARELAPLEANPAAIRYGLENMPNGDPPTVLQFRAICNRRPDVNAPAITNEVRVDPEQIEAFVARIQREPTKDYKAWAKALKSREEGGESLSAAQRGAWREALKDAA